MSLTTSLYLNLREGLEQNTQLFKILLNLCQEEKNKEKLQ